jgi:hypothetical protein
MNQQNKSRMSGWSSCSPFAAARHRVLLNGMPAAQARRVGWATFEAMIREKEIHQQSTNQ